MERIIGAIVAVVLGLLALAGVGAMATDGFGGDKASKQTTDITQIINNARAQFSQNSSSYANFATANVPDLITAGIFPDYVVRGTNVFDRWGNVMTVSSLNGGTTGQITVGGGGSETAKQCAAVATALKDYVSLQVGGTTFTPPNQPDAQSAGKACGTGLTITVNFQ